MTKDEMLQEMEDNAWGHDLDENSTYEEVFEEYNTMNDEYDSAEDYMYPNGRDYDSENFDD